MHYTGLSHLHHDAITEWYAYCSYGIVNRNDPREVFYWSLQRASQEGSVVVVVAVPVVGDGNKKVIK